MSMGHTAFARPSRSSRSCLNTRARRTVIAKKGKTIGVEEGGVGSDQSIRRRVLKIQGRTKMRYRTPNIKTSNLLRVWHFI